MATGQSPAREPAVELAPAAGAPVAAATFGLPEQAGGERNWDYRFTWVRDGSLSMHALAGLGYLEEAGRFGMWLRDRVTEHVGEASGPLKIMYRVDGSSDLTEETLFSEEIGPTGEQLGNFPQAFTHPSLINAAITLNTELDRRAAHPDRAAAMARIATTV